jgi:uncharacterized protein (TIGR03435 family)
MKAAALLALASSLIAQTNPPPRHGDVTFSSDPAVRGRAVTGAAITLIDLCAWAYNLRYDEITGGPAWATTDHFDLEARADGEGGLETAQSRQMLQALLATRFRLKAHYEAQETEIYALKVGDDGPKLTPRPPDATGAVVVRGTDKGLHMETTQGTMEQLVRQLSVTAVRPVLDRTGLTGLYSYKLDWWPANRAAPPDVETPSMFVAVQQLGLKLESARGTVRKFVIDSAEKPREN